jgi:DNA mismatch repair protein MutS2
MSDIREIPGIGDKTARRLIEHFGSEKAVMDAFLRKDVAAIAAVPGIGEKNAVTLVQRFIFRDENISPDNFLKTREGWRVYRGLLTIIQSYASTSYAKDKINIYFPVPSLKKEKIVPVINDVSAAIKMVNEIAFSKHGIEGFRNVLKGIKPIREVTPKKVKDRVLVAGNSNEYQHALSRFGSVIDVILAASPRELLDSAGAYHYVTASIRLEYMDFPHDVNIAYEDLSLLETWQAVPESEIAFFSRNLESITSAVKAYAIIEKEGTNLFSNIDPINVSLLESALNVVGDNDDIRSGTDERIDRLESILDRLDSCIKKAEQNADRQFQEYLNSSIVTLTGKDLLDVVGGEAKHLLDREMAGKYKDIINKAVSGIVMELNLDTKEALLADNLFSIDLMTEIQAENDAVERLRQFLNARLAHRRMDILRDAARTLSELKDTARHLVSQAMELDVWFSVGLFAKDCRLVTPQLLDEAGIEISKGRNLFLTGDVEPVDYALGTRQSEDGTDGYSPELVAVLSGVNSGGKTSTLDLIAQTLILSHMGFPVPAKYASVGPVDELYYFGKSGGTMDAGAFESTIREFSVVSGTGRMAVLADELESITEPGASARIIGGILEALDENPHSIGVFVSHLAESIMEHTSGAVRVDGIEARGLDEHLNLIVDRNPRYNYVAKSTPELIVERLARQAKGSKKKFYERLLRKFK